MKKDTLFEKFNALEIKNLNQIKGGREIIKIKLETDTGTYYDCWDLDTGDHWIDGPPVAPGGER